VAVTDQVAEVLRDRIPYILFGTVFLFVGFCVCGIAVMRHRSGGKFFTWLGIWSAIEGIEYLFGSLADLGLLPNWLLASLPYAGNILSFSVVVIALLAFLDLSQDKLRLFLQGAIVAGLAIAVAGIALFLGPALRSKSCHTIISSQPFHSQSWQSSSLFQSSVGDSSSCPTALSFL
jgi:hypothetical protein